MKNNKPTPAIRVSDPKDRPDRDFDLVGPTAWLAIKPPLAINAGNRQVDLQLIQTDTGFEIVVYYADKEDGGEVIVATVAGTWQEMELAWQAMINEEEAPTPATEAANFPWFNYALNKHKYIAMLPTTDRRPYIPQNPAAQSLYQLYLDMGKTPDEAMYNILKLSVGEEPTP